MNKKILIIICILLVLIVPAGVFALNSVFNKPETSQGGYYSEIIDRVNISVDSTDFEWKNTESGPYEFSFVLTLSKTEPDFYGRINSVTLDGISYNSIVFEALDATPGDDIAGLEMSAENEMPVEYSWRVTVSADTLPDSADLVLNITSGMTMLTSETNETEIPLSFSVSG